MASRRIVTKIPEHKLFNTHCCRCDCYCKIVTMEKTLRNISRSVKILGVGIVYLALTQSYTNTAKK